MAGNPNKNDWLTCNGCGGSFNIKTEGGIAGEFGILPVAFCPTCLSCVVDMVHQMYPCPKCETEFEEAYDEVHGEDG